VIEIVVTFAPSYAFGPTRINHHRMSAVVVGQFESVDCALRQSAMSASLPSTTPQKPSFLRG